MSNINSDSCCVGPKHMHGSRGQDRVCVEDHISFCDFVLFCAMFHCYL